MLKVGIGKGRIEKEFIKELDRNGYDVSPILDKERKLIIQFSDLQLIFIKARDLDIYFNNNLIDVAVIGSDIYEEYYNGRYSIIRKRKMSNCCIAIAGKNKKAIQKAKLKVCTEYPKITKKYFENDKKDIEIIKIHGSAEVAPLVNLCDIIVDIVETGKTLVENNLIILNKIFDVDMVCLCESHRVKEITIKLNKFLKKGD